MSIQNKIIIITAPSGSGKTSITHYLMKTFGQLSFSVSATTRKPRGKEVDGVDYYFIDEATFKEKINHNEFVEWEMVYEGTYYGTLVSELQKMWNENKIPVLDIDVKGAIHVKRMFSDNTLSIFIEPPSIEALRERLESRGTESAESLKARLDKASYELSFKMQFDRLIMNDNLEHACSEAQLIVGDFIQL